MFSFGGRSSTSGHLSKDYETVTPGTAEHVFLGVPLTNDLFAAPPEQLGGLLVLVALIAMFQIRQPSKNGYIASLLFWSFALAVSIVWLPQVTWIPCLTTIIYTRTSYPYLVVIPHCMVAAASYRTLRGPRASAVESVGLGFLCWGFGGSIVSDVLMGLPATALGHARIIPCYLFSWMLVWYSPFDAVYRAWTNPASVLHFFLAAWEAVDGVTTPMGRISRSARELNNKGTAPLAAGLFAGVGGSLIRTLVFNELSFAESAVWKTMGYSVIWWYLVVYQCEYNKVDSKMNHCDSYNGSEELRVAMVCLHVLWTLMCEFGVVTGHPFVSLANWMGKALIIIASTLKLGPAIQKEEQSKLNGGEKTEKQD